MSHFVEAGGIRWHVQQSGEGSDVVLIHGTGSSSHTWREVLPLLAPHFRLTALDLPGHGQSGAARASGYSIDGMSCAVGTLLRTLAVRPRFGVGHSAGAVILSRMALDHDIDPRVIVSINGAFVPWGGAAGLVFGPLARFLSKRSFVPRLVAHSAGRRGGVARMLAGTGSTLDPPGVELYRRLIGDPQHVAAALNMMSEWNLPSFHRQLPRLRTPLVLLAAANDRAVPVQQAFDVQALVPNARVRVLPNLGHLAHEERPALLAEEILAACRAYEIPPAATVSIAP